MPVSKRSGDNAFVDDEPAALKKANVIYTNEHDVIKSIKHSLKRHSKLSTHLHMQVSSSQKDIIIEHLAYITEITKIESLEFCDSGLTCIIRISGRVNSIIVCVIYLALLFRHYLITNVIAVEGLNVPKRTVFGILVLVPQDAFLPELDLSYELSDFTSNGGYRDCYLKGTIHQLSNSLYDILVAVVDKDVPMGWDIPVGTSYIREAASNKVLQKSHQEYEAYLAQLTASGVHREQTTAQPVADRASQLHALTFKSIQLALQSITSPTKIYKQYVKISKSYIGKVIGLNSSFLQEIRAASSSNIIVMNDGNVHESLNFFTELGLVDESLDSDMRVISVGGLGESNIKALTMIKEYLSR